MNLVIGKFYPPHLGHHWLIDQALADGPTIVAIMWSNAEQLKPDVRKRWINDEHEHLKFVVVRDELPIDFNDKELSFRHAKLIDFGLGPHLGIGKITKVFGCEPYIPHLAEYFNAEPVMLTRSENPVSATMFRSDPRKHWDLLRPAAKAGLCKRVVCIGAESSGTTTLARALADHYDTVWVPEYGRLYSEGMGNIDEGWTHRDFANIAGGQRGLEAGLARHSKHGLLICDTNTLATHVWEEFLVGDSLVHADESDLFILTELCPWEDDGTRFGKHFRGRMQWAFKQELMMRQLPWIRVVGNRQARLAMATAAIDRLTWDF